MFEEAVTSISGSNSTAFMNHSNSKIRMTINIKNSTAAKDISGLSDGVFYRGFPSPELIFAPNTKLRVDKVFTPDTNGIYELIFTVY